MKHTKSYNKRLATHESVQCKHSLAGSGIFICLLDYGPRCSGKGLLYQATPI